MVDDVVYGCANQAGEDNRKRCPHGALASGLSKEVPGTTVNGFAVRAWTPSRLPRGPSNAARQISLIAGAWRACREHPLWSRKADAAYSRSMKMEDTTIGWHS